MSIQKTISTWDFFSYNHTIGGGIFDIGQDKQHLGEFQKSVDSLANSWINMFVTPESAKGHHHSQIDESLYYYLPDAIYNSLPNICTQKFQAADHCFFRINGQTDNAINTHDLFKLVNDSVSKSLDGMQPKQFWAKFFGKASIYGIFDGIQTGQGTNSSGSASSTGGGTTDTGNFDLGSFLNAGGNATIASTIIDQGASAGLNALGIPASPGMIDSIIHTFVPGLDMSPNPSTFQLSAADWVGTPYAKNFVPVTTGTGTATKSNALLPIGAAILLFKVLS